MKKIIALLLALVMIFALVACDNKETTGTTAPSTPSSTKAPGTETTAEPVGTKTTASTLPTTLWS